MTALTARERVPEVGSSTAIGGAVATLQRARRLVVTRSQPMLALKAFSAWLRLESTAAPARAFGLLDFSLHCNKFAMEQMKSTDVDGRLRLVGARDYYQLVLDEFEALYSVHVPLLNTAGVDEQVNIGGAMFSFPESVPVGLLTALMVTIHNWACLEMAAADDGVRTACKLFAASQQIEEQLQDSSGLGSSWEAVKSITSATRAVMKCDFFAAETAARRALELIGINANSSKEHTVNVSSVGGDTTFLQAVAFYALGSATEVPFCEDALQSYEEALRRLSQSPGGALHQPVMEQTRSQLLQFVEGEHSRERARLAAEDALSSAHPDRKKVSSLRLKRSPGAGPRTVRKASNSRTSVSGQNLSPVVAPPVPEPLKLYLADHGLSTFACLICSFKGVFDLLKYSLPHNHGDSPLPPSLFDGTRYEASGSESIFAVPLCSSTPLQWTLRLRDAASQLSATAHRSVWTPRPALAPLLTELAAQRPPGSKSASASQTRKEITEGNSKLQQQVLQLFVPTAAASKAKKNAHDSVETVVQLLGQRLSVLLKTERAFEDHWTATERVSSALRSYTISQDLVRLKKTLQWQQRLRQMRRERSARAITHFFRDVIGQRGRRVEQSTTNQQQLAERESAATVLQKYTRRWLALQEARKRAVAQAAYVKKVVLVQSLARKKFAQAAYGNMLRERALQKQVYCEQTRQAYAALQIQRVYRGHCSRLRCYHILGLTHEATLHHLRDSRNYYATLLQKHIRGMLVRLRYGKAVYAKRCYGRNVHHRQLWERSCVFIQRAFRAHQLRRARSQLSANRATKVAVGSAASRRLLAGAGEELVSEAATTEFTAAQRIQSAYRSGVAKRRLEALRYARVKDGFSEEHVQCSTTAPFVLKDCVF